MQKERITMKEETKIYRVGLSCRFHWRSAERSQLLVCLVLSNLVRVDKCQRLQCPFIMIFLPLSHVVCKHTHRHVIVFRSVSLATCRFFFLPIFKYCPWAPFSSIVSYLILGYLLDINVKFFGALAYYAIPWTMNGSRASLKRGLPTN